MKRVRPAVLVYLFLAAVVDAATAGAQTGTATANPVPAAAASAAPATRFVIEPMHTFPSL